MSEDARTLQRIIDARHARRLEGEEPNRLRIGMTAFETLGVFAAPRVLGMDVELDFADRDAVSVYFRDVVREAEAQRRRERMRGLLAKRTFNRPLRS